MFGLSTSRWYENGEVGVEENPQVIVQRYVSITISNSHGLWLRFLSKAHLNILQIMWIYIVWIQKVCIKQDNLAKQNVSQVSRGKALPVSYSRNTAVSIISPDAQSRDTRENSSVFDLLESSHSLSLTHNPYN